MSLLSLACLLVSIFFMLQSNPSSGLNEGLSARDPSLSTLLIQIWSFFSVFSLFSLSSLYCSRVSLRPPGSSLLFLGSQKHPIFDLWCISNEFAHLQTWDL